MCLLETITNVHLYSNLTLVGKKIGARDICSELTRVRHLLDEANECWIKKQPQGAVAANSVDPYAVLWIDVDGFTDTVLHT